MSIAGVADDALALLRNHYWLGNIRELENVLERTILFCKSNRIEVGDLPEELLSAGAPRPAAAADAAAEPGEPINLTDTSLKDLVRAETSRVERELIAKALEETGGNVTQAAKLLKISRKSLQMKMKEFGLRDREAGAT
jgi:DNA-binding NtrC family response regulator